MEFNHTMYNEKYLITIYNMIKGKFEFLNYTLKKKGLNVNTYYIQHKVILF